MVIVEAIDRTLAEYHRWSETLDTIEPESGLADELDHLRATHETGDIPQHCRTICDRVARLCEEWRAYTDDHRHTKGKPFSSFHGAIEALIQERKRVVQTSRRAIPTVRELMDKEKCTYRNVAVNFSRRVDGPNGQREYEGPLWFQGAPAAGLIDQEREEHGSVLTWDAEGNWVPPWDEEDRAKREKEEAVRLQRVHERAQERAGSEQKRLYRPTEAEILKYLRKGGYIHKVHRAWAGCDLTVKEIQQLANRAGFEPASQDAPYPVDKTTGEPLNASKPLEDEGPDEFDHDAWKAFTLAKADAMGSFESPPRATAKDVDSAVRDANKFDDAEFSHVRTTAIIRDERKRRTEAAADAVATKEEAVA